MKISFAQNMGMADRMARACIGLVLMILGSLTVGGTIGILFIILSIPLLVSALVGFCPAYVPFGISTKGSGRVAEIL